MHGFGCNVLSLPSPLVVFGNFSAVNNVRVKWVSRHVTILFRTHGMPFSERHLPIISPRCNAHRATFLLPTIDVVRKIIVCGNVIKLSGGLIVPRTKRLTTIHRHDCALVAGYQNDVRIIRIYPNSVVIVPARCAPKSRPIFATVHGFPSNYVSSIDNIGIFRVNFHFRKITSSTVKTIVARHFRPRFSSIIGAINAAHIFVGVHGSKKPFWIGRRNAEPDATQTPFLKSGQAIGQRSPSISPVRRFEKSTIFALPRAIFPRALPSLPQISVNY